MNQYETVFILTPVLLEDQVKEAVKKFEEVITSNGGEIVNREYWGLKKLAYPIRHKSTGFYQLFQFKASGELINSLETEYRRDEKIIRFLTVKLDKYAVEYSEKRANLKKQEKVEKEKNEKQKPEKQTKEKEK